MPEVIRVGTGETSVQQGFPKGGRTLGKIEWTSTCRCEWTELDQDLYAVGRVTINMSSSLTETVSIVAIWEPLSKQGGAEFFSPERMQRDHCEPAVYDKYFEEIDNRILKANRPANQPQPR